MAKKDEIKNNPEEKASASDYYRLKTKAVDDLVNASVENTPVYSEEELTRYSSRRKLKLGGTAKALLMKFWFNGAVCFFIFWGLGTYIGDSLDMLVLIAVVMGMVTDLLVNSIFRYYEAYEGENDIWMMFPKRKLSNLFLNIPYAGLVLFFVYSFYNIVNREIIAVTGAENTVPFGVEPIMFGLIYLGFDMLFISIKNIVKKAISEARTK